MLSSFLSRMSLLQITKDFSAQLSLKYQLPLPEQDLHMKKIIATLNRELGSFQKWDLSPVLPSTSHILNDITYIKTEATQRRVTWPPCIDTVQICYEFLLKKIWSKFSLCSPDCLGISYVEAGWPWPHRDSHEVLLDSCEIQGESWPYYENN